MRRLIVGLATTALLVGGVGLSAGTAHADWGGGPYRWCPGQPLPQTGDPHQPVVWDMNTCHTCYRVGPNQGNVGRYIWDGPNPPDWHKDYHPGF
jgi:hypothetical protein